METRDFTKDDYGSWTEDQLYVEIARRQLSHGVNEKSFPVPEERRARLASILSDNDRFAGEDGYDKEIEIAADHIRRNYPGDPVGAGLAAVLAQDGINYRHGRGGYAEKPADAVFRQLESDLHEDALDRAAEAMLPTGSVEAEVEALLAAEAEETGKLADAEEI